MQVNRPFAKGLLISLVIVELVLLFLVYNSPGDGVGEKFAAKPDKPFDMDVQRDGSPPYVFEANETVYTDGTRYEVPLYKVSTNSRGLREEDFRDQPPENTTRILVLGDSFTFGFGLNRSDRYTDIVERRLNQGSNKSYQVVNAWIGGWGIQDYYLFLKKKGLTYNPDFIIVSTHSEDVISTVKRREFLKKVESEMKNSSYQEINEKRESLVRDYANEQVKNFSNSSLSLYMNKIDSIVGNETGLLFYIITYPDDERRRFYRKKSRTLDSKVLLGPRNFTSKGVDEKDFTLPGPDNHYNALGNEWLANKLYRYLAANVTKFQEY